MKLTELLLARAYVSRDENGAKTVSFKDKWQTEARKLSEQEIVSHLNEENGAIAMLTGKANEITVIDFDDTSNPLLIELAEVCPTYCVQTYKGFHFYYRYTPELQTGSNRFGQGVDVRNDGGLVFCPPTPHYQVWGSERLAELNQEAKELLNQFVTSNQSSPSLKATTSRNDTLFRKARGWIEHYSPEEVWSRMVKANRDFQKGELDDRELETMYQQVLKYKTTAPKEEQKEQKVDYIPLTQVLALGKETLFKTIPKNVISFGYDFLDEKLTGIFPGDLAIIGGETGTGKTVFATNIIYKASKSHKCVIFALEDRLHDYGIKALYFEIGKIRKAKGLSNYSWNEYRKGEKNQDEIFLEEIQQAETNLANENIEFAKVEVQLDIETLEILLEEKTKQGVKLFLIDHLHYFDLTKDPKLSKADYIEKFMVRLKLKQNIIGSSILLVVHYKKLNGAKPTMDSFKDSMAITQNASYVISLWRDRENDLERYKTIFFLPKTRNPNGEGMITVNFDPNINDYTTEDIWSMAQEIFNPEIL